MCIVKDKKKTILMQWKKSVTKDYNYLFIVMNNSAFDYSLSGLLVLHKLNHFLRIKKIFSEKIL